MKLLIAVIGLVVSFGIPAYGAPQGTIYGGLQYSIVTYDEEGVDDVEPTALVGRLGRFINENLAIEGRLGIGLEDDDVEVLGIDVDVEVENIVGIYAVIHSDTTKNASFYGVLGFTRGELEAEAFGLTVDGDESGFSYGLGVNIGHFNIEYMSYLDEDDFEATAISIGFMSSFD